jgi:regulatory protein
VILQDPARRLMQKAGAMLARRAYSRGDLRDKLAKYGEAEQIEPVLDRLEELELLNDAEYAYNCASRLILQEGWGPAKVRNLLRRKKIAASVMESALERMRTEIDDVAALNAYLDRRGRTRALPQDRKGIHRLFMSLRRRGFPAGAISQVLRQRVPSAAWLEFDTGE